MERITRFGILVLIISGFSACIAHPKWGIDLETGTVRSGYNDVRIPGTTGTFFSLSEDFKAEKSVFFRFRLNYAPDAKNTFSILIAPLTVQSAGQSPKGIQFQDDFFPMHSDLNATFKFNSYRLTYRREIVDGRRIRLGLGLTGKIRDAEIGLKSETLESTKKNVGFVPLINFNCSLRIHNALGFLLSGDALAAPQGRAEDVLAALTYGTTDRYRIKIGYRILEGGADNDEVYTFSLFHYWIVGLMLRM